MWSFPITPSDSEGGSSIPVATELQPTACEIQCSSEQKALVSCVDSIRAARADDDGKSSGADSGSESTADTPACLPLAVAAWTKCCEEANIKEKEENKDDDVQKKTS